MRVNENILECRGLLKRLGDVFSFNRTLLIVPASTSFSIFPSLNRITKLITRNDVLKPESNPAHWTDSDGLGEKRF